MRATRTLAIAVGMAYALTGSSLAGPTDCATKGDGNNDCRIAFDDVKEFVACLNGPETGVSSLCACHDANDDGDVDLLDFLNLQTAFTGANLIPGCNLQAAAYEPASLESPPAARTLDRPTLKSFYETGDKPRGVYLFSGEVYFTAMDLHIPGRGIDFVWARKYRSRVGPDTPQGVGWDYGYNVWIEAAASDLVLHDGNTRADLYRRVQGANGTTWCAPEFFREIAQDPNGSYVCRFASRDTWRFHPLDASPQAGKLVAITDTNGNALSFAYNGAGRLATITDTLGRPITVAYDVNNRIRSVTDFSGRQVQYDY